MPPAQRFRQLVVRCALPCSILALSAGCRSAKSAFSYSNVSVKPTSATSLPDSAVNSEPVALTPEASGNSEPLPVSLESVTTPSDPAAVIYKADNSFRFKGHEKGHELQLEELDLVPERQAIGLNFADTLAEFAMAQIDLMNGDLEQAADSYLKSIELDRNEPISHHLLYKRAADSLILLDRREEAHTLLRNFVHERPHDPNGYALLGHTLESGGNLAAATALYQEALKRFPKLDLFPLSYADLLVDESKYVEATTLLQRALTRMPNSTNLYIRLGQVQQGMADIAASPNEKRHALDDAAGVHQHRLIQYGHEQPKHHVELACIFASTQNIPSSVHHLAEAERMAGASMEAKAELAQTFARHAGGPQNAAQSLAQLSDHPDAAWAHYYRGILIEKEEPALALRAFRASEERVPPEAAPYLKQVYLALDLGKLDTAFQATSRGLEDVPDNPGLLQAKGHVQLLKEDYAGAITTYRRIRQILADHLPLLSTARLDFKQAIAHTALNEIEEAADYLIASVTVDPAIYPEYLKKTATFTREQERRAAGHVLEAMCLEQPHRPFHAKYYGYWYRNQGLYRQATTWFVKTEEVATCTDRGTMRTVLSADFYFAFGDSLEALGRLREAEAILRRAIALRSSHPEACHLLARVLANQGVHLNEALELCQRSIANSPETGTNQATLGWIHFRRGEYEEALAAYTLALDTNEADASLHARIADVYAERGNLAKAAAHRARFTALSPEKGGFAQWKAPAPLELHPTTSNEDATEVPQN